MFKKFFIPAVLSAVMASGAARADSTTATFNVSATVVISCTVSVDSIDFGNLSEFTTNKGLTAKVSPVCNVPVASNAMVSFDGGKNYGDGTRAMANAGGTSKIKYSINYQAPNGGYWPYVDNSTVVGLLAGTSSTNDARIQIFIPAQTAPAAAGAHSDIVTVTLTY